MIYLRHRDNKIGDGVNVGSVKGWSSASFLAVHCLRIAKKENLRPRLGYSEEMLWVICYWKMYYDGCPEWIIRSLYYHFITRMKRSTGY